VHAVANVYAIKTRSTEYHLVEKPLNRTLCAQPVSRVPSGLVLRLVPTIPVGYTVCQECERVKKVSQKT